MPRDEHQIRELQVRDTMVDVKLWLLIKDLHSYGLNLSQISRKTCFDRKTVHKYIISTSEPEPRKRARKELKLDV